MIKRIDITRTKTENLAFSADGIPPVLLILFLAMPFVTWTIDQVFEILGTVSMATPIIVMLLYVPVIFLCMCSNKYFITDFWLLLFMICIFYFLTYLFHPEYEFVYTRENYGVLEYVLRPDNGIYIYLFIRLVNEPSKIIKCLKISGYVIYAYSVLRLSIALSRGYWVEQNYLGEEVHLSYNMSFGYDLLIFVCCFLYCALKDKHWQDWLIAGIGVLMILMGGSRGPLLGIILLVFLYCAVYIFESKHRLKYLGMAAAGTAIFIAAFKPLLRMVASIMNTLNLSSRTVTKLLEGSFLDDNGRNAIWEAALEMINNNPFGYGAMGARHALYELHIVGHPHNIFLEILIEYGVIFGIIIIFIIATLMIYVLFSKTKGQWRGVFIIFSSYAGLLLLSYTYWHSIALWGVIAIIVCALKDQNRRYEEFAS